MLALFTRPEKEAHTHGKSLPAAGFMRALAEDAGVPVFAPASINSAEAHAELARLAADLFVVCDYGQILSSETLGLARWGGINLHGSLLPKYRGAAPVQWALYHGDAETGVTVIHMTPKLDAGPSLVQRRTPIDPDETAIDLEPRLAELGMPAVLEAIDMLTATQGLAGVPQDSMQATAAPRLRKEDGRVNWTRDAEQIRNQVRAFQPWPTTYTFWRRASGGPLRIILEDVKFVENVQGGHARRPAPGTAVFDGDGQLAIVCGKGAILPQIVQPAGKRAMSIGEFLRGHAVKQGDRFGEPG
jgi:methionyl-tRNA formyltransferase